MSGSSDYILPGHSDRIGDWPVQKLMWALEDMLFDNEHGYLPPSVAEAVQHLSNELFGRGEEAEEQAEERRSALGRQLDRWFPAEKATVPALRGEQGVDPTLSMSERFLARGASVFAALAGARERLDALEPANDREESGQSRRLQEPEIEPGG